MHLLLIAMRAGQTEGGRVAGDAVHETQKAGAGRLRRIKKE
jgi:hypothetical protein